MWCIMRKKREKEMRGRDKFEKVKFLLKIIIFFLKLLPKKISKILYDLIYNKNSLLFVGLRYCVIKRLTFKSGENIYIAKNVVIKNFKNLNLGNNVSIHEFCYVDAEGIIEIGNDVSVAHGCSILSSNHDIKFDKNPIKDKKMIPKNTKIKNNVWLGAGAKIMAGVTIEEGCVIGAGSVVTKSTEKNSVYGGVPASKIKIRG